MESKTLVGIVVLLVLAGGAFYFMKSKPSDQPNNSQDTSNPQPTPPPSQSTSGTAVAIIETSMGSFEVTLDGNAAPKTVANFLKLAEEGFYKNLTFHRIVKTEGFHLIQGGDPNGDGTGGPGYTVPAEIKHKHVKGAVATARLSDQVNPDKESSGSQFYIVLEDIPQLDGGYTVFGYVTSGMDVVEKIGTVETDASDRPVVPVVIKNVSIKQ
jgi:cyclophilin family peptidyl-prolyl cis-trans isomerase